MGITYTRLKRTRWVRASWMSALHGILAEAVTYTGQYRRIWRYLRIIHVGYRSAVCCLKPDPDIPLHYHARAYKTAK